MADETMVGVTPGPERSADSSMQHLRDCFNAMIHQERTSYCVGDYLATLPKGSDCADTLSSDDISLTSCSTENGPLARSIWREKICEWSFRVVDHFSVDRELVYVAMSHLDRFSSRNVALIDKKTFQLLALTSLCLAMKLYVREPLPPKHFIQFTRDNMITEDALNSMEKLLLRELSWKLHPPTPQEYLRIFMKAADAKGLLEQNARRHIADFTGFLAELSTCDYFFVKYPAAVVAVSSILNASDPKLARLENMIVPDSFSKAIAASIHEATMVFDHMRAKEIEECMDRQRTLYIDHLSSSAGTNVIEYDELTSTSPTSIASCPFLS